MRVRCWWWLVWEAGACGTYSHAVVELVAEEDTHVVGDVNADLISQGDWAHWEAKALHGLVQGLVEWRESVCVCMVVSAG